MLRIIITLSMVGLLASCGGNRSSSKSSGGQRGYSLTPSKPVLFATGPIASACIAADRKAASRARCGCVQAVANRNLNSSEQARGVSFIKDPQKAQDTRQAGGSGTRFFKKWSAYGTEAERLCS